MVKLPNKKQRGQIIILMMFAIIPIFLLMATIFNGGYLVAQKTRLQNATDTSALLEASWTARSLNIMSMNNTAITQSQAITSAAWAMEKPLMDIGLNGGLVAGFYVGRAFRVATLCGPWCLVLAPLVYTALLKYLSNEVLEPLYNLQRELKRAIHTDDDQGFAKAAASFGRMNKILVEKFPDSIEEYSDTLLHANYSESATIMRYTAWADKKENTGKAQMPVIEQSFADALGSVLGDRDQETDTPEEIDNSTGDRIKDAIASVKDIRDIYNAGLKGTTTNPYNILDWDNIELNYFGNFRAQGYEDGEGPFNRARGELETDYDELYNKINSFIDGGAVADAISEAVDSVIPGGWLGKIIRKIVRRIANAIFKPLAGTAYAKQEVDTDNFKERLDEVWEWSSIYGESNYTNTWRVDARINLILFDLFAAPRTWRGILPGIYHGQNLGNLADGVDFDRNSDEVRNAGQITNEEKIEECLEEHPNRLDNKIDDLKAIEWQNKSAEFQVHQTNGTIPMNYDVTPARPHTLNTYTVLSDAEVAAIEAEALRIVSEQCLAEYDEEQGQDRVDEDGDEIAGEVEINVDTDVDDADESALDEGEGKFTDLYGNGTSGSTPTGGWRGPKKVQEFLTMINWFFEPAYQVMKLPFPLDASLLAFVGPEFLGSDRSKEDPNLWCGAPFGEGFICTNEVPLYAVNRQRLFPQFALDAVNAGAGYLNIPFDLDDLPDAIRENFIADRDDWSVVVGAKAPATLLLGANGFGTVPTEMSTISQAEVYNSQWFDLFTQTWKAKLTPVAIFEDNEHYLALIDEWHEDHHEVVVALRSASHDGQRVLNH